MNKDNKIEFDKETGEKKPIKDKPAKIVDRTLNIKNFKNQIKIIVDIIKDTDKEKKDFNYRSYSKKIDLNNLESFFIKDLQEIKIFMEEHRDELEDEVKQFYFIEKQYKFASLHSGMYDRTPSAKTAIMEELGIISSEEGTKGDVLVIKPNDKQIKEIAKGYGIANLNTFISDLKKQDLGSK